MKQTNKTWYVYFVRCNDQSLYAGITTELSRRVTEHNSTSLKAAKYTRNKQPVSLVYYESATDRASASKREWQLKQLSKEKKEQLVKHFTGELKL